MSCCASARGCGVGTCPSQNRKHLRKRSKTARDHARSIFPSENGKTLSFGVRLDVDRAVQKCTRLWCEARFEVKISEASQCHSRACQKEFKKWTQLWREAYFEVNMPKTQHARCSHHFWVLNRYFGWWDSAHYQDLPNIRALQQFQK